MAVATLHDSPFVASAMVASSTSTRASGISVCPGSPRTISVAFHLLAAESLDRSSPIIGHILLPGFI